MGRPRLADRSAVRAVIVTLKLTEAERAQLDALVRQRIGELKEASGQRCALSASAFIRWLLHEHARKVMPAAARSLTHPTTRKGATTTR